MNTYAQLLLLVENPSKLWLVVATCRKCLQLIIFNWHSIACITNWRIWGKSKRHLPIYRFSNSSWSFSSWIHALISALKCNANADKSRVGKTKVNAKSKMDKRGKNMNENSSTFEELLQLRPLAKETLNLSVSNIFQHFHSNFPTFSADY